jgi:hypothetical protein
MLLHTALTAETHLAKGLTLKSQCRRVFPESNVTILFSFKIYFIKTSIRHIAT